MDTKAKVHNGFIHLTTHNGHPVSVCLKKIKQVLGLEGGDTFIEVRGETVPIVRDSAKDITDLIDTELDMDPKITTTQLQVLRLLVDYERSGPDLRNLLNQLVKKRSAPQFYTIMARCEKMGLVNGRIRKHQVDDVHIKERLYTITPKGMDIYKPWLKSAKLT